MRTGENKILHFFIFQTVGNQIPSGLGSPVLSSGVNLSGVTTTSPLVVSGSQLRPLTGSPKPVVLKRDISIGNFVTADGTTTFKLASQGGVTPTSVTSPSPRLPNIIRTSQQIGNWCNICFTFQEANNALSWALVHRPEN